MNSRRIINKIKFILLATFIFLFGCSSPLMDIIKEEVAIVVMPPGVATLFPEADSIGNSISLDDILLTFTKQIDGSSVNSSSFVIKDDEDNIVSGTYSVSNDTISFNPSSYLSYNTTYTVTAKAEILDVDGNQMGAEFSWSFTTADAPSGVKPLVKYVRVNDNQSATNTNTVKLDISATDYTGNIQNLKSRYRVAGTSDWSDWLDMTNGILTIPTVSLDVSVDGEIVTFEVEVKDSANIVSNLGEVDITYDISAPEVISRNWLDAGFDLTQSILQISFDGEMDLTSFSDSNFFIELESTPGALQGQIDLIEYNELYNSAVILQGVSLNPYTDYKITLGTDIKDIAGNERGETSEWTFRTGKANDVTAPDGDLTLIDRGVSAYETILPNGTLATDDYRIRLDLSNITDDYSTIVGMKFWGDWDNAGTPSYTFEPSSWELFPGSLYKDWNLSDSPGTKTVLYKFIDSNNQSTEGALQVEVFLDNVAPTDPIITINEGAYTNNSQRIISLNIDSSDTHTGIKEMNIYDSGTNTGWIDWSPTYDEWTLPGSDGSYTITVSVRDYLNQQSNIDTASIILDRIAPVITFNTENILIGTEVQMDGTYYSGTDERSGIASYLWEKISGPGTIYFDASSGIPTPNDGTTVSQPFVTASAEGSYYLQLTITDNAGNSTSETVLFSWDATPPGNIGTIDVTESNPNYSTSAQPTWSWSAATDADYYRVTFAASPNWATLGPDPTGAAGYIQIATNSFSPNSQLTDGLHTLTVNAFDNAGNYSVTDISKAVTIDTVAPTITITNNLFIDNAVAGIPTIDFGGVDGSIVDNTKDGYASGIASNIWSKETGTGLITFGNSSGISTSITADTEGTFDIRLIVTDVAGNSTSANVSFLKDTIIPGTPDVSGPSLTPNRQPTWYWSSAGDGLGSFQYQLFNVTDGGYEFTWTSTNNLSFKPGSLLTDQKFYRLEVQEIDVANNWSNSGTYTIEVDSTQTTPAQITIGDGEPALRTINTMEWDVLTGSGGIATDYRYYYDGSGTWIYGGTGLPNGTPEIFDFDGASLSEGNHSITIQEYFNSAWQTGKTATHTITVDTIDPNMPNITSPGLNTNDSDRKATSDLTPTWTWSGNGGGNGKFKYGLTKIRDANGNTVNVVIVALTAETSTTSYTASTLANGTYKMEVQERDSAGNWSSLNYINTTVDNIAPILTSVLIKDPTPYVNDPDFSHTNSTTVNVTFMGDISAENEDVTLTYLDYNPATTYETYPTPFETDGNMTISTVIPSTNGTRSVYARLVDEAGNVSAYRNDSIILDTVAPTGTMRVNNNVTYTPSLSYKLYFDVTDNLSQSTALTVSTRDVENSAGGGTNVWSAHRTYSAIMSSDYQFSDSAGGRYAYSNVYDEAGNSLYLYDYIILQVPEPTYAYKGYYTSGYSNVYYNSVTEDPGTYLTRYYVYSTSDPNADPNNGDPVTYESYTTSTSYKQAYIPKGEILYFFTRAYNADTGGYGPYSSSSVMGFSSNVTVVYDKSDSTDSLKAQYIKELLEDTYYDNAHGGSVGDSILDQANMAGTMPSYSVTLLDEDLINNSSFSTNNLIYGDPIIVTPGTAFSRLSSTYDIRARHIAASGKGIVGMGSNGLSIFDRIKTNWTSWGLTGTSPTQVGSGPSAGLGSNKSSQTRSASTSESIWHSPMQNTYLTANFYNSNITLNVFNSTTGDVYRNGVYLTIPVVTDGYVYAGDPNYSTYFPVVRQGRFLEFGYYDIPGRGHSGATTYLYGQVFFINLIARMDNY